MTVPRRRTICPMSGQEQRPATFEDAIWLKLEAIHGTLRAIEGHAKWLAGVGTFFVVLACVSLALGVASFIQAF